MADTVQSMAFVHTNNNGQRGIRWWGIVGFLESLLIVHLKEKSCFPTRFLGSSPVCHVACCLGSQFILLVVPRNIKPANIVTVFPFVCLRGKIPLRNVHVFDCTSTMCSTYVSAMTSAKKRLYEST